MKDRYVRHLRNLMFVFGLMLPVAGFSASTGGLSQTPLFISPGTQHNLVFLMDDSSQMDLEVLVDGADYGKVDGETLTSWFGYLLRDSGIDVLNWSEQLIGSANYGYLFETYLAPESNGVRVYNGQRLNEQYMAVPPINAFGFMRSSAYNRQYYDPAVEYHPWPGLNYSDAGFGNPQMDPNYPLTFEDASSVLNSDLLSSWQLDFLTGLIDIRDAWKQVKCDFYESPLNLLLEVPEYCQDLYPPLAQLHILPFAFSGGLRDQLKIGGEASEASQLIFDNFIDGSLSFEDYQNLQEPCLYAQTEANVEDFFEDGLQDVFYQCLPYVPATYFVPVAEGSYRLWGDVAGLFVSGNCAAPNPAHYGELVQKWSIENNLVFTHADGSSFDGVLAPDGQCLEKVTVNNVDGTYNPGTSYERGFVAELQNFSNWFQYHRRRHHSARYGLGESMQTVVGVNADLLTVNDQSTPVSMLDMSDKSVGGDFEAMMTKVYHSYDDVPSSNANPLRQALGYVGTQYQRSDNNAPIQYECQRNYALMYTGGYVTDYDVSTDTLAELAASYFNTNLRSDLAAGKVRVPGQCLDASPDPRLDCNTNLHMNTYGVVLGAQGTLFGQTIDGVTYTTVADAYENQPDWPDANDTSSSDILLRQIDDVYEAAYQGKGEIYNVRLPTDIADGLNRALEDLGNQSGAAAAVTFSTAMVESGSLIFSAAFNSQRWSGQFSARSLNSASGKLIRGDTGSYIGNTVWDAAEKLDNRNLATNDREILTFNPSTGEGVPFRWGSLVESQRKDLLVGTDGMTTAQAELIARERLAWLRGDRSDEEPLGDLRTRDSRLGDLVHSAPVFVGRPSLSWPDLFPYGVEGARYSDFRNSNDMSARTPVVYVGANDGTLHAFEATREATGGRELFAFIPNLAFSDDAAAGLNYLTDPAYLHRYYVDLTPTIADVYVDVGRGDSWRTLLIGGMRAGGRGLFALDVTNPDAINESSASDVALWEFLSDDLGYVIEPVNVMMTDLGAGYEWVAVFGNGLDAPSGRSGLFMLRLEGGLDGVWSENTDYWFFEVDAGPSGGMNADVRLLDLDSDNLVDRIYTSDLEGRIWAFAYDQDNDAWLNAHTIKVAGQDVAVPLFTAAAGQKISSAPMVVRNPQVSRTIHNVPNLLVLFGTGQYLNQNDVSGSQVTESFYGIWDSGAGEITRSSLFNRDITETDTADGRVRNLTSGDITWGDRNGEQQGWYIDFDTISGERVVMVPQVRGNTILFNTTIPPTNECSSNGGSFRMFVDLDGSDPDEQVFDTNGDGLVNSQDILASGFFFSEGVLSMSRVLGNVMFDNTAGGVGDLEDFTNENVVKFGDQTKSGRLSWHEVIGR
ncbi:pilus assembly protein [Marinobacter mobilis]|uniref:Type IV pilus assembly protein PilY1 n=1 Tax=Marinobacter mobilis TaxID=488533 RepID=A0A1H3B8E0_9GAMM|nr:PilC/PilY family type IV pilus protein [Marinobacter mobilis]SDX37309.1 type IV pilus assembly protein PilY1 [Marinobacter mobilis]